MTLLGVSCMMYNVEITLLIEKSFLKLHSPKGQLISKCLSGVYNSPKKRR